MINLSAKFLAVVVLIFAFFITSCSQEEGVDYVLLSGRVVNRNTDSVYLQIGDRNKSFVLDMDGNFSDTVQIKQEGYYEFSDGREHTSLYLIPKDSLFISLDCKNFWETIKFTGIGAQRNNYLIKKITEIDNYSDDIVSIYDQPANQYKSKLENIKNNYLKELQQAKVESIFLEQEKKNLDFEMIDNLVSYPEIYEYFKKEKPELPENFYEGLDTLKWDNEYFYKSIPSFRPLALKKAQEELNKKPVSQWIHFIGSIKSPSLKNDLVKDLTKNIVFNNPNYQYYNQIVSKLGNKDQKNQAQKNYKKANDLQNGKPSPKFKLDNKNGNKTSLTDLKGKPTYIFVWKLKNDANKKEFAAWNQLVKTNENINMVSISADKYQSPDLWKKYIEDNGLKGIQLLSDNGSQSGFLKAFYVDSYPRFILVDANGNILQSHAPEASSQEIGYLLNSLINKSLAD